uniref:Methyltransferase domain-containing protein n=1 Tax=Candidatus Kentrum sp. FM TaxID=2126340 RepID=A0A450THP8_9GAMM|nr:MAG: hypothetical protein BECKFM1743A_GA0114220_103753 [Candidatus Kentron sp. FM]VFJ66692.1 MAG: hypothetical protein BECKFM1743C_GA0114222_104333 [Candidatus Kentron sp. FM]VFK13912.1 MAG: hypothetical protein BECKFM1743B_GA0114221_102983 [Candidatus Kentron sp. FM]
MFAPEKKDTLRDTYTEEFFLEHQENLPAYRYLARLILSVFDASIVESVCDVGCGHGFLVECLRQEGISQSFGLDGSISAEFLWNDTSHRSAYSVADLTSAEAVAALPSTDIVCSFETGEHLPKDAADTYIRTLTHYGPAAIFFSAATPFQNLGENPTHINEQQCGFWITVFARCGYKLHVPATVALRNRMFSDFEVFRNAWWYPKNLLVFVPNHKRSKGIRLLMDENGPVETPLWFPPGMETDPVSNLMFERDFYEYLYIVCTHAKVTS